LARDGCFASVRILNQLPTCTSWCKMRFAGQSPQD